MKPVTNLGMYIKGLFLVLFQMCGEQSFSDHLKPQLQARSSLIGAVKVTKPLPSTLISLMLKECIFVGGPPLVVWSQWFV